MVVGVDGAPEALGAPEASTGAATPDCGLRLIDCTPVTVSPSCAAAAFAWLRASVIAAFSAAISPADGLANKKPGPSIVVAPAWVAASMTRPTIAAVEVIDNDSLAAQRLIRCLCPFGPTRIRQQVVLIDSVWIPDAAPPTPRTAWTIAATRRFAAESAGGEVAAKRVTDSE